MSTVALVKAAGNLGKREAQFAEVSCEKSQPIRTVFVRAGSACGLELFSGAGQED
jgi:hypothetical protein